MYVSLKPLPAKVKKADIAAALVALRSAAGIGTDANHFDDMIVKDMRALHAKIVKSRQYPMGTLEYVDLIIAVKRREGFTPNRDVYAQQPIKWLKTEWERLARVCQDIYGKTPGPKRLRAA